MNQSARKASSIGQLVGRNLRRVRMARGETQEELARALQAMGLPWSRPTVASLETGRRADIMVSELLAMSLALGVPVAEWFEEADFGRTGVPIAGHLDVEPRQIQRLMTGRLPDGQTVPQVPSNLLRVGISDAESYAARTLGIPVADVVTESWNLWHRRLVDEREARMAAEPARPASAGKADRKRVTRQLLAELSRAIGRARLP